MIPADSNSQVEEILRGSFDLHVHAGPDPNQVRRLDALDTGRYAHEAEMAGFVLKSHHYPTAATAQALSRIYPDLQVLGSIVLNREVGGLNPVAVEAAARIGANVVWMPTHAADSYMSPQGQGPGLRLTDDTGGLRPEVSQVVDIARDHDLALASGHVSPQEALTLFTAARKSGVKRLIATHPQGVASDEEIRQMVALGAYVEHTFLSCMPSVGNSTPAKMVAAIRAIGVEHCVVSTDFGQWMNPPPAEGMRMAIAALLDAGMTSEEVSPLVKGNALWLVGLESSGDQPS